MGKQIKKVQPKKNKKSRYMRLCNRCGNEVFSMSRSFRCNFCGGINKFVPDGSSQQERKEKHYG